MFSFNLKNSKPFSLLSWKKANMQGEQLTGKNLKVFNSKSGSFAKFHSKCLTCIQPLKQLLKFSPVNWRLLKPWISCLVFCRPLPSPPSSIRCPAVKSWRSWETLRRWSERRWKIRRKLLHSCKPWFWEDTLILLDFFVATVLGTCSICILSGERDI